MKLRIKSNSLRLRLTKPEVEKICVTGYIEDQISFGDKNLSYALKKTENAKNISAEYSGNIITVSVPGNLIKDWSANDVVGFSNINNNKAGIDDELLIIIEKDFKCLERTSEDQSDNYENPNKTC